MKQEKIKEILSAIEYLESESTMVSDYDESLYTLELIARRHIVDKAPKELISVCGKTFIKERKLKTNSVSYTYEGNQFVFDGRKLYKYGNVFEEYKLK